jgi:hypothetical protein
MLESELERDVVDWAKDQGGRALKLELFSERGFPDRTIVLPGGRIAFPELKRRKGSTKRYEQQKRMVAWLTSMGLPSAFCSSLSEVEELFE